MNMKLIARIKDILRTFSGRYVITLESENRYGNELKTLLETLPSDKIYSVEINEAKSKRSIQQNKYLWALLHEIDIADNGKPTDEYEYYIQALERANAKYEFVACTPKAEQMLKEQFRAVKFIKKISDNVNAYKVYLGSSKMNSKEMTILIDCVLDMASEYGIETDYWKEVLK